MGWLNTILDVTSAGAGLYNAAQLQTMRQQGVQAAAVQALIARLRDEIFQIKQMAEFALSQEVKSTKIAAALIGVVESRLRDSGITPDLFSELGDKEYTAQAIRLIAENNKRLTGLLTLEEQREVDSVVATADRLSDYAYYLEYYSDAQQLAEADDTVNKYKGRNGCLARAGISFVLCFVWMPLLLYIIVGLGGSNTSGSVMLSGLGVVVLITLAILFSYWLHSGEYKAAKKLVDKLMDSIDLPRFVTLAEEFGDVATAKRLQDAARSSLDSFFGDSQLLSS